ncbi:tubulin alpha chain-like isoform X2 [Cimex lectularius]|nr:tubulin alpha chain-like isoform X2 [Cimex lectularius]
MSIFRKDQMIHGNEYTCHVYAKGHGFAGKKILDQSMEAIRIMAEECDHLQGFIFYRSLGGGTGTGFTSLLTEKLTSTFDKIGIHEYSILPGSHPSSSAVAVYNTVLSIADTLQTPKCAFMFDNNILFKWCKERLNILDPSYSNMNDILARILSSITASLRFQSALNVTLDDFHRSLIPHPQLCFPLASFAPISPSSEPTECTAHELIKACFSDENQLLNCRLKNGEFLASSLMFSGNVRTVDANKVLTKLRSSNQIKFVDWCQSIFKAGFNPRPTHIYPKTELAITKRQLCMLTNTTELSKVFRGLRRKYEKLIKKKAFFHLYMDEGMEERDFFGAAEKLHTLEKNYEEIQHNNYCPKNAILE